MFIAIQLEKDAKKASENNEEEVSKDPNDDNSYEIMTLGPLLKSLGIEGVEVEK